MLFYFYYILQKDALQIENFMKRNYVLVVIVILFLWTCGKKHKVYNGKTIKINISAIKDSIVFSDDKLDIVYIPLETNDKSLIGRIDKIYSDTAIYVLDSKLSQSLFVFDKHGKFISKISARGQGPGEYTTPLDFMVSKKNKNVWILDLNQKKAICYENFVFKTEKKIPTSINSIIETKENIIGITCFCLKDCFKINILDKDFNITKGILPFTYNPEFPIVDLNMIFSEYGDTVFYNKAFSNKIFAISPNLELKDFCYFDFGKDSIHVDIETARLDEFNNYIESKKTRAFGVDNFVVTDNFYFFTFYRPSKVVSCFSKKDRSKILMTYTLKIPGVKTPLRFKYMNDKFMFFQVEAKDMVNKLEGIKDTDNPVLIKIPISELEKYLFGEEKAVSN